MTDQYQLHPPWSGNVVSLAGVLLHVVEPGLLLAEAEIAETFRIFLGCDERAVRGVGGDVGEEGLRLVGLGFGVDPVERGGEEDIGAEALGLLEDAVVAGCGGGRRIK